MIFVAPLLVLIFAASLFAHPKFPSSNRKSGRAPSRRSTVAGFGAGGGPRAPAVSAAMLSAAAGAEGAEIVTLPSASFEFNENTRLWFLEEYLERIVAGTAPASWLLVATRNCDELMKRSDLESVREAIFAAYQKATSNSRIPDQFVRKNASARWVLELALAAVEMAIDDQHFRMRELLHELGLENPDWRLARALTEHSPLRPLFTSERTYDSEYHRPHGRRITPIGWAAIENRPTVLEALVKAGVNPGKLVDGVSPLMLAASAGSEAVVLALLSLPGIDPNQSGYSGLTPLNFAARNGNLAVVAALLSAGASPNQPDVNGQTPLIWAGGHVAVEEALLDANADVNWLTNFRRRPLDLALEDDTSEKKEAQMRRICLLLKHGAQASLLTQENREKITAILVRKRIQALAPRLTAEGQSSFLGTLPRDIAQLVANFISGKEGCSASVTAASTGDLSTLEAILAFGGMEALNARDPISKRTPILAAIEAGHDHVVQFLLDAGVDINPEPIDP